MLTPSELSGKRFEKAVFGGYQMQQVDDFFKQIATDYAAIYKDNALLKSKLKTLVTTVEEYRSVDEAMRKALLNTQRMCETMIDEAQAKARDIVEAANREAGELGSTLKAKLEREERHLERLKDDTVVFVNALRELYTRQLHTLEALSLHTDSDELTPTEQKESNLKDTALEIEQNISAKLKDTLSFAFVQQATGKPETEDTVAFRPQSEQSEQPEQPEPPERPEQPEQPGEPFFSRSAVTQEEISSLIAVKKPAFPVFDQITEQAEALPADLPGSPFDSQAGDNPKTESLQDTLARLHEMDKALSAAESQGMDTGSYVDSVLQKLLRNGEQAMEEGEEDTVVPRPRTDFESLSFGKNYKQE